MQGTWMNPYAIIGVLLAAAVLWFGGQHHGDTAGYDRRAAEDQAQFDKINHDIADQKALANGILRSAQANVITLMGERDKLKTRLEQSYVKNQQATADLRAKYSGIGLRFSTDKGVGRGASGGSSVPGSADAPSSAAASVVELPGQVTSDLRQLTADADSLRDAYRLCYDYAQQVR